MGNAFRRKQSRPCSNDVSYSTRTTKYAAAEDNELSSDLSQLIPRAPASVLLQVDMWSDHACPWCYISKIRLHKAIKNIEATTGLQVPFLVIWHPYMIDLNINPAGEERLAYNKRVWKSDEWTNSLRRSGAKDGVMFKKWTWWPNSLNGHRLVQLAGTIGKAEQAKDALFGLTYEGGENVSDLAVLCSLGEQLGLDNVREYLVSDRGKQEILQQDKIAKQLMGIKGVPYLVFNRKYVVAGSKETHVLEALIRRMLKP